jgi:hypothetical protein
MTESAELRRLVEEFTMRLSATIQRQLLEDAMATLGGGAKVSPTRRAPAPGAGAASRNRSRRLQGKYLGTLRGLKGKDRSAVQNMAREKGVRAALKLARGLPRRRR